MSYFFPVILAVILHLSILFTFILSPFSELAQSRSLPPRHINAQMYDIKKLTTAKQKEKSKVKDVELDKKKQPEPKKVEPKKEEPKKEESKPKDEVKDLNKEREELKKEKTKQRQLEKDKLIKDLNKKKADAAKQREIESKRKIAAKEKAKQAALLKEQQRKNKEDKKKLAKKKADEKAAADKKRKDKALADQKKKAKQRKAQETARIKALQKQIADEERFAADQIAKELASGVGEYIKRILSSNLRIPSTARNGITAQVRIKLLPSGRIVGVQLIESSGNSAFDKAAEQAVWRSESFPKVAEVAKASPAYFNRELRTFIITFKPEELRW